MTRHIPLQGVENFRDFGDYAAGQGRLKKGVLFRAAHQAEATDQDLAAMAALGIVTIVDLRRPNERERDPSRRWEGFAAQVIDNDMGVTGEDPWHTFLRGSDLSVASIHDYLVEYYRRAPFKDRHLDLFRRYFQAVAQARGPVLIHCAAGKDRTGLLAALTHHVAGVSDDDVIDDYLLTNNEERFARRGPKFAAIIETATGRRPSDAAMRTAMGVEADYLATAIAEMKGQYGSVDGYLERAVGLDAAGREAVRAHILA
ncbi:protein tyrosine phosphatase [Caulobacter sp. Root655]|uniref:tyrosine-protein phosphatase n=1 Tax=Caulobacter sp. Root655 TaxID=1736578 RepID=UPI0006FE64E3|nr:tyrosine-protein phosphatase [Caulobacter sp. Root655]KRA66077.1 protein tyrosine phosphatase [Caulobacter sp. Root655]